MADLYINKIAQPVVGQGNPYRMQKRQPIRIRSVASKYQKTVIYTHIKVVTEMIRDLRNAARTGILTRILIHATEYPLGGAESYHERQTHQEKDMQELHWTLCILAKW